MSTPTKKPITLQAFYACPLIRSIRTASRSLIWKVLTKMVSLHFLRRPKATIVELGSSERLYLDARAEEHVEDRVTTRPKH